MADETASAPPRFFVIVHADLHDFLPRHLPLRTLFASAITVMGGGA